MGANSYYGFAWSGMKWSMHAACVGPQMERVHGVGTFEGIFMETVIRKWGNSPALRLPSGALKEAGTHWRKKWSWSFLAGAW